MTALTAFRILVKEGAAPGHFEWLLRRVHVGTPDSEITADIDRRTRVWPETARQAARVYALACHRHKQRAYRRVVSGRS